MDSKLQTITTVAGFHFQFVSTFIQQHGCIIPHARFDVLLLAAPLL